METPELKGGGVGPGDRVGLLVNRDRDLLPAIVGALDAGAAYAPLDPTFRTRRLRFMVQGSAQRDSLSRADSGVCGWGLTS